MAASFKDITVSFANLIKTRSRSPFYGTLFLIYTIKHYDKIYQLFFISSTTLKERLGILNSMFEPKILFKDLAYCILYTFITLIISYLLINLSKMITGLFHHVINEKIDQLINKITDFTNTYSKDDYKKVLTEKENYEKSYDVERNRRYEVERERNTLDVDIKTYIDKNNELLSKISIKETDCNKLENEINNHLTTIKQMGDNIEENNKQIQKLNRKVLLSNGKLDVIRTKNTEVEIIKKFNSLDRKIKDDIIYIYDSLLNNYTISDVNYLINLESSVMTPNNPTFKGLINVLYDKKMLDINNNVDNGSNYKFTKYGKILIDMVIYGITPHIKEQISLRDL